MFALHIALVFGSAAGNHAPQLRALVKDTLRSCLTRIEFLVSGVQDLEHRIEQRHIPTAGYISTTQMPFYRFNTNILNVDLVQPIKRKITTSGIAVSLHLLQRDSVATGEDPANDVVRPAAEA